LQKLIEDTRGVWADLLRPFFMLGRMGQYDVHFLVEVSSRVIFYSFSQSSFMNKKQSGQPVLCIHTYSSYKSSLVEVNQAILSLY
jgi:hypothetical protein